MAVNTLTRTVVSVFASRDDVHAAVESLERAGFSRGEICVLTNVAGIGGLTALGVPESDARLYAEGLRRGLIVVTVRTGDAAADPARQILDSAGAVDLDAQASGWRDCGPSGSDPGAEPLSADELRRERKYATPQSRELTPRELEDADPAFTSLPWPHQIVRPIDDGLVPAVTSLPGPGRHVSRIYDTPR